MLLIYGVIVVFVFLFKLKGEVNHEILLHFFDCYSPKEYSIFIQSIVKKGGFLF